MRRRIQKHRLAFFAWLMSLALLAATAATFWLPFGHMSNTRQVFVVNGRVYVLKLSPVAKSDFGWHRFKRDEIRLSWNEMIISPAGGAGVYLAPDPDRAALPLDGAAAFAAAATTVLFWRRPRRSIFPRCADCGYDLAGNTSGRCPECGTLTE